MKLKIADFFFFFFFGISGKKKKIKSVAYTWQRRIDPPAFKKLFFPHVSIEPMTCTLGFFLFWVS